jgi:hypothetical protein
MLEPGFETEDRFGEDMTTRSLYMSQLEMSPQERLVVVFLKGSP